jgi:predicted amidohydrolase
MRHKGVTVVVIATSAGALVLASVLATAEATRTVRIASHITIKSNGLTFSGSVTSSNAACRGARKVTLYRKQSQVLGSTTTNSSGSWKITASGSAGITLGHFYATVKKRSEGTAGTIYVCRAATSKTIAYRP